MGLQGLDEILIDRHIGRLQQSTLTYLHKEGSQKVTTSLHGIPFGSENNLTSSYFVRAYFTITFRMMCLHRTASSVGLRRAACLISDALKSEILRPATFTLSKKYFATKVEEPSGEIIYIGPLSKQIRGVKLFSLMTSITGIIAQPVILERANQLQASLPAIIGVCTFVGFFTFVTPVLLHLVTRKYVTSISYNELDNTYTAYTYSLFMRRLEHKFKPGDVMVPDVPGMLTTVSVKGTPLFFDARFFEDVDHYKKIMGYDKPMDFKLSEIDQKHRS